MSLNAEIANAARWINARAEVLPADQRPDVVLLCGELMDELEDSRSVGSAELALPGWRHRVAEPLGVKP